MRRIVLAMIMALALALGPLAMASGEATTAAPASHHEAAQAGHCDQQPQPEEPDQGAKGCCIAGCNALAAVPAPVLLPTPPAALRERPAPDRFRLGYLGEIATPPPRRA